MPCPAGCGYQGVNLEYHYRHSPHCRPAAIAYSGGKKPAQKRSRSTAALTFANLLIDKMGRDLKAAHEDRFMQLADLDHVRTLIIAVTELTLDFVGEEIAASHSPTDVLQDVRAAYRTLPNVGTMISMRRSALTTAKLKTLSDTKGEDRKGAVFLSAFELVTIMLQESDFVRKEASASNKLWKSGVLYNKKPPVYFDLTHGSRFTGWHEVCGAATADERNDFRALLHGWTDEFTPTEGLSPRARHHKYGAFLATLVNVPLRVRHYVDHVLVLALYNSRYAKENGGLVRMLTGRGTGGTQYKDGVTFAGELALSPNACSQVAAQTERNIRTVLRLPVSWL
jgi:hypothetical protein